MIIQWQYNDMIQWYNDNIINDNIMIINIINDNIMII